MVNALSLLALSCLLAQDAPLAETAPAPTEADYYALHTVTVPEGLVLEVGGLLPRDGGSLLVCTRRGDVFLVTDAAGDAPVFHLWADGLQEPLGLLAEGDSVLVTQRGELTRLSDTDGDLLADVYETVNDDWELSGSYHEYAFGPARDPDGNLWMTFNIPFGDEPFGTVDWRGWAMRLTPEGELQPVCAGLRSPAGVEVSPWGDVFYTDNQGEWNGASKLSQLVPGSFHGHPLGIDSAHRPESRVEHPGELPDGILMPTAAKRVLGFTLPAVWFPYDLTGRSPSGLAWDTTGGAFGPFDGQLFVGDQYGANVLRVFLEQVDGVWQGACFRFREGLQSGVIRVAFDEAGGLWAGSSDRGWASLGPDPWGLQRITWTGQVPFEIKTLEAHANGFTLTFTAPVDETSIVAPVDFELRRFTYRLHSDYGSPEVDDWPLEVTDYALSPDRRVLELTVPGLREGYVHEIIASSLRDVEGRPLLHSEAWYTLKKLPGAAPPPRVVFVAAEPGDLSEQTLPLFARILEREHGFDCRILHATDEEGGIAPSRGDHIDDLDALRDADIAVLSLGNLTLSEEQLDVLLRYVDSGRPYVALRSTLQAFAYTESSEPDLLADVEDFAETTLGVLDLVTTDEGGHVETASDDPAADLHPILRGVTSFDSSSSSVPGERPLTDDTLVLLTSSTDGEQGTPVLWTRNRGGARVVVTTLGHAADFQQPAVRRVLLNSILWALDLEANIPDQ